MEVKCSFCERTDIHSSDGDMNICNVCHIEEYVFREIIRPKLRKIAADIVDNQLKPKADQCYNPHNANEAERIEKES